MYILTMHHVNEGLQFVISQKKVTQRSLPSGNSLHSSRVRWIIKKNMQNEKMTILNSEKCRQKKSRANWGRKVFNIQ